MAQAVNCSRIVTTFVNITSDCASQSPWTKEHDGLYQKELDMTEQLSTHTKSRKTSRGLLHCVYSCVLLFFKIIFWLHWVFVAAHWLSLVAENGLLIALAFLVGEHRLKSCGTGLSCSAAWVTFPGQGSNLCPLNCQADSNPLYHQGSPKLFGLK